MRRFSFPTWFLMLTGALVLPSCTLAATTSLPGGVRFLVDFEEAAAVIGEPVPTGTDGTTMTEVYFGDVKTSAYPGTGSNAAEFNTTGNTGRGFYYDQTRLALGEVAPQYVLAFDFYPFGLAGSSNSFVVIFDSPGVNSIRFRPDGVVQAQSLPSGPFTREIGSYNDGESIHVQIAVDTIAELWSIQLNGQNLGESRYTSDEGLLEFVRFSLSNRYNVQDDSTYVYVDNISLSVPEVSPMVVFLLLTVFALNRRVRLDAR